MVWATIAAIIATPFVALAILLAVVASGLAHLGPTPRKHLNPVPIAASACPYVVLMHTAANNFQIAEPIIGMAVDEHGKLLSWPQTRARLAPTLAALEYSIQASEPHFPPQVQQQLTIAAEAAREGRAQLAVAHDGTDLSNRTTPILARGQLAFGYASDLVGQRCGVPLGADDNTFLYPFRTITTIGSSSGSRP